MLKDIIYIYFNRIKNKSWRQYSKSQRSQAYSKTFLVVKNDFHFLIISNTHTQIHAQIHIGTYIFDILLFYVNR